MAQWVPMNSDTTINLYYVYFANANIGYAAARGSLQVYYIVSDLIRISEISDKFIPSIYQVGQLQAHDILIGCFLDQNCQSPNRMEY